MALLGLSANASATALHVPAPRINDVVRGKREISPETTLCPARYFGTAPEFWANLQAAYDLRMAWARDGAKIEPEIAPLATV